MPIYDYRCTDCRKRFSLLVGVVADSQDRRCPGCGSDNLTRLISRFSSPRSEDAYLDDLADPSRMGDLDDPGQLHSWMKRMGKEMGHELGDDFGDVLDEMEAGGSEEDTVSGAYGLDV